MLDGLLSQLKQVHKICLPLHVYTTKSKTKKSKFILNLNNYRNTHFTKLNLVKHAYTEEVKNRAISPVKLPEVTLLHFKYYHGSKRRIDVSNPCSIIDKFAADAFTELGWWEDDDSKHYPISIYEFCGVDKDNPRCEILFYDLTSLI